MFDKIAYWPRVRREDGRVLERALAGPNLLDPGVVVDGAVIEASFAGTRPSVLQRLQETGAALVIDPGALRFTTSAFLEVASVTRLPYAPDRPIDPSFQASSFVREALAFQDSVGASAYMVPAVPSPRPDDDWSNLNRRIHEDATRSNGLDVPRKPLIAFAAPGWAALRRPKDVVKPLLDMPIGALYLQPTRLQPNRDSVEKLVAYSNLALEAIRQGIPVIAGRVGAFGLVLVALGVGIFDSGLGDAEGFDLASRNRILRRRSVGSGRGGNRRVYFRELKTTLMHREVEALSAEPGLRARFVCSLPCCRWQGWEDIGGRRRDHNLRVRLAEVDAIRQISSPSLRIQQTHKDLEDAQGHAAVVRRFLEAKATRIPKFSHLDTWLSVMARLQEAFAAA
jgi:hypothetical protein